MPKQNCHNPFSSQGNSLITGLAELFATEEFSEAWE